MTVETERARRKDIFVDFVKVSPENMKELAEWCNGKIRKTQGGAKYIQVHVRNPQTPKQSKAFAGDVLLHSPTGFKVYTEAGFQKAFELAPEENLTDTSKLANLDM